MISSLIEYSFALVLTIIAVFAGWQIICLFILEVVNPVWTGLGAKTVAPPACRNTLGLIDSFSDWINTIEIPAPSRPNIEINLSPDINIIVMSMLFATAFGLTLKLLSEIVKKIDFAAVGDTLIKMLAGFGASRVFGPKRGASDTAAGRHTKLKGLQHNSIFISYRRKDSADNAGRIHEKLTDYFGKATVFMDVDSIRLGADFPMTLKNAVFNCKVLLAVIGDKWLEKDPETGKSPLEKEGDFVRFEIESALMSEIPVIQLLVQGAGFPKADELPPSMKKLPAQNGMPIRSGRDFKNDINYLIEELETILKKQAR